MNERTCIVTRMSQPADQMIRFVAAPDGEVVPDLKARLPGRGAWVSADGNTVRKAMAKGFFPRALKCKVNVPDDLDVRVGRILKKRALNTLGMAVGAGQVVAGFSKSESAILSGKAGIVLHAADGAPDGLRKLKQAARNAVRSGSKTAQWVTVFNSDELGLAMGRQSVVHAVVKPGRMADDFAANAMKWCRFEGATEIEDDMTKLASSFGQE